MEDFITKELDFKDVFILPQPSMLSSRKEVNLERSFNFVNPFKENERIDIPDNNNSDSDSDSDIKIPWTGIPIIAANMDTTGTFQVYNSLKKYKMLTALNKFYFVQDYIDAANSGIEFDPDFFMVTTGITEENFKNLKEIVTYTRCKWICVDVANGYMDCFVNFCKKIRYLYPDKILVAGNVVTPEMVSILVAEAGVNVVKIGIGSGSACLTRRQTGVGRPQLHAIRDCSEACKSLKELGYQAYIISDGGIKYPGDMAKAFGAGADFVMAAGIFAGHDENPGELIEENNKKYKLFYGMSSKHAMEKYFGKMEKYRSSEGDILKIEYKGPIENTVQDFLGGLRSTGTYIGAKSIEEFPSRTVFVGV
jgi:GMP reductase